MTEFECKDILRWTKVWQDHNRTLTSDQAAQVHGYPVDDHWDHVLRIVNSIGTTSIGAILKWDGQQVVDWRPPDHDTVWDGQYVQVVDRRTTDYDDMNLIVALWSETEDGSPVERILLTVDIRDKGLERFFPTTAS